MWGTIRMSVVFVMFAKSLQLRSRFAVEIRELELSDRIAVGKN